MADDTPPEITAAKYEAFANGRYHADRESFLDSCSRLITFGILVTGGLAFFQIFGDSAQAFGVGAMSVFALAKLVWSPDSRARTHNSLRKRYFDLVAQLTEEAITAKQAQAKMLRMAGEEEPPFCAVHALAENWASEAVLGKDRPLPCRVKPILKFSRHIFRYDGIKFVSDRAN